MGRILISFVLGITITLFLCGSAMAEIVEETGSVPIAGSVSASATLNITILDRTTELPGAVSLGFNGGVPIDQSVAPKWMLSDQMLLFQYDCNAPQWAIRMVTDNITGFPGILYQNSIDGTARWTQGLIRAADDIYNRARIVFQVYNDPTPTGTLDDNYIYGLDLDGVDPVDYDDPGDIAPVWGLISDKGDSLYAGWDGNGDGDMNPVTDTGLDLNADGDYLDDGEYPPDVAPNPISSNFQIVYGAGTSAFLMPYPEAISADGTSYIYFGADLGDGVAAGSYGATIYLELFQM